MDTKLLALAIEAAIKAGNKIMEIYETDDFDVDFKADDSPLTRADIASHEVINKHLFETNIPILSEEGREMSFAERKDWDQLWVVDPIDGTKEFIKKNGEFTVNIALIDNQIPILGVIYVPVLKELYYSSQNHGAFKKTNVSSFDSMENMKSSSKRLPLNNQKRGYTVVASRSHLTQETQEFIEQLRKEHGEVELISKGSSLKLCMVAEGAADCYPRFAPTMEWDTAAGQAICIHAGFDVIDWKTQTTMKYNRENLLNNWFLVK